MVRCVGNDVLCLWWYSGVLVEIVLLLSSWECYE